MKAIDTNVVIRLLIGDDPAQQATARALISEPVLVTITVMIESAWVLRSRYGFDRATVAGLLSAFLDYPNVLAQAETGVRWALARYRSGGDIADLLHIAAAEPANRFVTFDRGIAPAAGDYCPLTIETLA
ncbi:type II toxin-antitoxin system VapC family toxin [Sphingomonas sp. LR60]|uniref:type II toxin-antitoxin system VapC family toxin n=1 Tax=Sphingomonas sp. LR60 TaxID=3050233 RepID=UPI002FE2B5D9